MSEEMAFFLFLIERYAERYNRPTGEVWQEWTEKGILQKIYDNYFQYHQERLQNAFDDINHLMKTGKHLVYV